MSLARVTARTICLSLSCALGTNALVMSVVVTHSHLGRHHKKHLTYAHREKVDCDVKLKVAALYALILPGSSDAGPRWQEEIPCDEKGKCNHGAHSLRSLSIFIHHLAGRHTTAVAHSP